MKSSPLWGIWRNALRWSALQIVLSTCLAHAGETVHIENATQPSRCAENDNVYVKLVAAGITHFTIEAHHPAYIGSIAQDSTAPDFTTCDQSHDPSYSFEPLDLTLYEDADYRLVGHRFGRFWRRESVDFRVGDSVTHGLHLIQLIRKLGSRAIEILVVYPSDGYWRIKPLPQDGAADTAYGSSFLVGPVEQDGRPYVALSAIEFIRSSLAFHLFFKSGAGSLRVADASPAHTVVEVSLPPAARSVEFAALRSMFVSTDIADSAEAILMPETGPPHTYPILAFPPMDVATAIFARPMPSRHNTSAPDLVFEDFRRDR